MQLFSKVWGKTYSSFLLQSCYHSLLPRHQGLRELPKTQERPFHRPRIPHLPRCSVAVRPRLQVGEPGEPPTPRSGHRHRRPRVPARLQPLLSTSPPRTPAARRALPPYQRLQAVVQLELRGGEAAERLLHGGREAVADAAGGQRAVRGAGGQRHPRPLGARLGHARRRHGPSATPAQRLI